MFKKNYNKVFLLLIIFTLIFYFLMKNNYFGSYCPDCGFRGEDFIYLPLRALINGINPYKFEDLNFLFNYASAIDAWPNGPVYGLVYYFIFLPFGFLEFYKVKEIWLIINCLIIIHTFIIIYKNVNISENKIIFVYITFLFSKSTVYSIALGQYTLIAFYGFTYIFFGKNFFFQTFLIICALAKFVFAPVIGLYLILKKKYLLIILLIIANVFAILLFSYTFDYPLIKSALNQFIYPSKKYSSGAFDLMTLIGNYPKPPLNFFLIIILTSFFYIYYYRNTKRNSLTDLASVSLITLIFIKHLYYDLIFLLPFLIFLFTEKKINKVQTSIIIYFYFFYFNDLTYSEIRYNKFFMLINFFIASYNLYYLFTKTKKNEEIY